MKTLEDSMSGVHAYHKDLSDTRFRRSEERDKKLIRTWLDDIVTMCQISLFVHSTLSCLASSRSLKVVPVSY